MTAPTVTERRAVERERAAFVAGCECVRERYRAGYPTVPSYDEEATRQYPMPKTPRPRVVPDPANPNRSYRAVDGEIEAVSPRSHAGEWSRVSEKWAIPPTAEVIRIWYDLLANPLEEVPDDAP